MWQVVTTAKPSLWSTVGKAIGTIAPSVLTFLGLRGQNIAQKQQAKEAMAFSERMANTQAQRAKADFEAAGFNPALAYGTQAASPSGQQANIQNELGSLVSSAQAARAAQASLGLVVQQFKTQAQLARKATADAEMSEHLERKMRQEQLVWDALASGRKDVLDGLGKENPLIKAVQAQFEATALQPSSIMAQNSAASANAKAAMMRAGIDEAEVNFLKTMEIGDGGQLNAKKIIDWITMLLRGR